MTPRKYSLRIEITLMLVVKLALLYLLWFFCFSHPIDKSLKSHHISEHIFGYSGGDSDES